MALDFQASEIQAKVRDEIQLELTEDQAEKLARFSSLLLRWNNAYNLTSIKNPEDVVRLHIADLVGDVKNVLDVGSGGGLPAIPLAIMRPDLRITMVDAVQKKTLFQKQACVTCRLSNVEPIHARIETLKSKTFEVVTSRAFASLKDMVELTRDVLAEDGRWLAMKGKFPEQEIEELSPDVEVEKKQLLTLEKGKIERVLIVLKRKVA